MKTCLLALILVLTAAGLPAQTTAFTYQGRLNERGGPASGSYDFRFVLYELETGGSAVAGPVTNAATVVSNGLFTVRLDFGSGIFTGPDRWLEIGVRTNGANSFTTLIPRQPVLPSPYSIHAGNADLLDGMNVTAFAPAVHAHSTADITSGVLAPARGGTGIDTSATPTGSLLRTSGTGAWSPLAPGANGQVLKISGGQLVWSADNNSGGTVTSLNTGVGLTGGPITTSGTIAIDVAVVPRLGANNIFSGSNIFSGVVVATNASNSFSGTFSGSGGALSNLNASALSGPLPGGAIAGTYSNAVTFNNDANVFNGSFTGNGLGLSNVNARTLNGLTSADVWRLNGNNVLPGQFLGSTNNQPVEIRANGQRALRLELNTNGAPNVIGGSEVNHVGAGVSGAVISGGGATNYFGGIGPNRVLANYGVVGGGIFNTVGGESSGVGSGLANIIQTDASYSVIAGGLVNTIQTSAWFSAIGGGYFNVIKEGVFYANIGGGQFNTNAAGLSVIGGGQYNTIQPFGDNSVIGGGWLNRIESGADQSVVAGGNAGVIQGGARESFIGGGFANTIQSNALGSVIGGGFGNTVPQGGSVAFIGGGTSNTNMGGGAAIVGGFFNRAENFDAFIGAGAFNVNAGSRSVIGGGEGNVISNTGAFITIGGGRQNVVSAGGSTIAGGSANIIGPGATTATISGGLENTNLASRSVVGGGRLNMIELRAIDSVVAGGILNTIQSNAFRSTISGGQQNTIGTNAESSTIGGGFASSIADGSFRATIGGGGFNTIRESSGGSTISGGSANIVESNAVTATLAGGQVNRISNGARGAVLSGGISNIVGGRFAVVPGGLSNTATGAFSFAAGVNASARHDGAFVWADSLGTNFSSGASNQFLIRASGGVGIGTTNPTTALEVVGSVKAGGFMDNGSGFTGSFIGNGSAVTNVNAAMLGGMRTSNFWQLNGNNVAAGQFLGSTNNRAVDVRVNNQRALRLEPSVGAPNIIGGADVNAVAAGVSGATISGGLENTIGAESGLANVGGGQFNIIGPGSHESTIGGGYRNTIETFDSAIGGGAQNTIQTNSSYSTIAGGTGNRILTGAGISTIGGGVGNVIDTNAVNSAISGGNNNRIGLSASAATVGGGENNRAEAARATVSGGSDNSIQTNASASTIGGGAMNAIWQNALFGTIAGGNSGRIENGAVGATIGGGQGHTVSENAIASVIAGGTGNNIGRDSAGSVISGGAGNEIDIDTDSATIDGGELNRISDQARWSGIGGGYGNVVEFSARYGAIGGGRENRLGSGMDYSAIAGGVLNFAGGPAASVGGGTNNAAVGHAATVPGGDHNVAAGGYSFAAGRRAKANHPGAFVWADSRDADFGSLADNQFLIRANFVGINRANPLSGNEFFGIRAPVTNDYGGMYIETAGTGLPFYGYASSGSFGYAWTYLDGTDGNKWKLNMNGADAMTVTTSGDAGIGTTSPSERLHVIGNILASGTITGSSDRNVKENFDAVNAREMLDKVAALPIARWNYKAERGVTHVGPMAQDFHAAFGVGADEKHISMVDADGVALAAIQGLNEKLTEELKRRDAENAQLKSRLSALEEVVAKLNQKGN